MPDVLITGAAGRLGSVLREGLRDRVGKLHLTDLRPLQAEAPNEHVTTGDLTDLHTALRIVQGVDAVVHTAGIPDEAPFEDLLDANVRSTYHVFEAARRNGVPRIIFTSSAHVVGFYPRDTTVDEHAPLRPDSLYGATKAFGEALARLYTDKYGIQTACLRIGSFRPAPEDDRQLSTWLSPRDAVQLVERCLAAHPLGHAIIYGVSRNRDRWWRDRDSARIGYQPIDDAAHHHPSSRADPGQRWQGGIFATPDYRGGAG
jgi:uronate dehydrogenase